MSTPPTNTLSTLSLSPSAPLPPPTPTPLTQPPTTLYPKIHKLSDLLHHIRPLLPPTTSTIHLTGTTKLHGTHADIVFSSPPTTKTANPEIRAQSRNKTLLLPGKNDNNGFAAFVAALPKERLWKLRERIVRRWGELNPEANGEGEVGEVILAGEWCGAGIQKGVAINQLARMFVVVSICVNGTWVDDRAYADLFVAGGDEMEAMRIFHVAKGGWFECVVDFGDVKGSEREMEKVTESVVLCCPFAKGFGVEGVGEGIVWKVEGWEGDKGFWCKSKGERWKISFSHKLNNKNGGEGDDLIGAFAKAVVTEGRLEQGWGALEREEKERAGKGFGVFLKWLERDVLAEEGLEMERLGIVGGGGLGKAIKGVAGPWFWRRVEVWKREGGGG